jgi:hypothetical protein
VKFCFRVHQQQKAHKIPFHNMIMFQYNGNLNNNAQSSQQMQRAYKPAVPLRKRVIEEPVTMTAAPSTFKKRRVIPKGIGQSIPLAKSSWWKFGGQMQKDLINGLGNSQSNASASRPPISSASRPLAANNSNHLSNDHSGTITNMPRTFGPVSQGRVASGFQSLPMKSKLNMSSTFSSTNPNPALYHGPPKTVVVHHNNSGTEDDSLHEADDDSSGGDSALKFRAYQAENWTEKFEELIEFRNQYGHCLVPNAFPENPALAQWVKRQRYQFKLKKESKRSTMSDERVRALDEIGFVWDSHSAVWEERLTELIQYKQATGHCNVPSRYAENRQLAVWVKRQRRQHKFFCESKPSSMTDERISSLEAIGFEWDLRQKK